MKIFVQLTQMLILILFFSNIGPLKRKTVNVVRFSIIKIRICMNFKHLRSTLILETCHKGGSLDTLTKKSCLKAEAGHFGPAGQKSGCFYPVIVSDPYNFSNFK